MDDTFRIYIDRLKDSTLRIDETISSDFLEIAEEGLQFRGETRIQGEAYLATDTLVMHLAVSTTASLPCSICNEWVDVKIELDNIYLTIPLTEVKGGVYDFREALRNEILVATPQFAEHNEGHCPQREEIEKFLKKEGSPLADDDEEKYRPFADL